MRTRSTTNLAAPTISLHATRIALAVMLGALLGVVPSADAGRPRAADVQASSAIALQRIGASGGSSQGLAVVGDRIYLGVGEHVEVLVRPAGGGFERVGIVDVGVGVSAVAAADGALWIGATNGTVKRYDLTDADLPVRTDDLDLIPAAAADGSASDTSSVVSLAIDGGRLFAALGDRGLAVVALEAGRPPRLTAHLMDGGAISDVGALGPVAYVADGRRGVVVVDATDADRVVERAVVPFGDLAPAPITDVAAGPVAVDAAAGRLYVAACSGECGFRPSPAVVITFDLVDPLLPRDLGRVATEYTYANDIVLTDDRAYLAITQCGPGCWSDIESFERTGDGALIAAEAPSDWGGVHRFVTALGIDSTGAVIAAEQGGGAVALSQDAPYVSADWSYVGNPAAVALGGGRMLVADADTKSVRLIDIGASSGLRPSSTWYPDGESKTWSYEFATGTAAAALDGSTALIADAYGGVLVLDANDAGAMTLVGRAEIRGGSAVAIRGTDVFVGTTGHITDGPIAGITHIDLSQPAQPIVDPTVGAPGEVIGLGLSGDRLFAILGDDDDGAWGVAAYDIRTARTPAPLGATVRFGVTGRAIIERDRLAVSDKDGHAAEVYDLANPAGPRLITRLADVGHLLGLWSDYLYIARTDGVDVYRIAGVVEAIEPAARIASFEVADYVPTAWRPGWVDDAGRVIVNRWGNGWTVLATVRPSLRRQAFLPVVLR